jgi:hypothetical protein
MNEPVQPANNSPKTPELAASPASKGEDNAKPAAALSPEEQMERFEDALKESDWGHQPC